MERTFSTDGPDLSWWTARDGKARMAFSCRLGGGYALPAPPARLDGREAGATRMRTCATIYLRYSDNNNRAVCPLAHHESLRIRSGMTGKGISSTSGICHAS